jgi:hypothetical protein
MGRSVRKSGADMGNSGLGMDCRLSGPSGRNSSYEQEDERRIMPVWILQKEIPYETTKRGISGADQRCVSRLCFAHRVYTDPGVRRVDLHGNAQRE